MSDIEEGLTIGDDEAPEPDPKPKLPAKRPVAYSPKLAEKLLLRIADGETLREIAKDPEFPSKTTVHRWIMRYPDLKRAWQAALELSAMTLEEEALEMARTLRGPASKEFTGTRVRAFEVAMNQFRWSASHRDAATYGSTAQPSTVVPIQIVTNLDIGQGGIKQTSQARSTYEVAATIANEYNASDAQIEGTYDKVEPGEAPEIVSPVAGPGPEDESFIPKFQPRAAKGLSPNPRGGSRRKGWKKSPRKIKEAQTRYARKLAKQQEQKE